ncbi:hypothetical protein [Picosynechococcus sp. PCC 8807]|uniref:hypothetical protein n=1 Tax=Picosynechococcus sp. PCC 8807 TaxID=195248 RepID=UPI000810C3CA|nr:hypothetical protein [Picosynechococcus sp. PCC 8807]ANV90770.1 hypothetical protein AWQ24_09075 [Picosynechococcus sp. PCC 8807]
MAENDKEKLFKIAMAKDGIQAADIAYYCLLFLPMITGLVGFYFWAKAILFYPDIPSKRLEPLLIVSCLLIGVPVAGGYAKNGK